MATNDIDRELALIKAHNISLLLRLYKEDKISDRVLLLQLMECDVRDWFDVFNKGSLPK